VGAEDRLAELGIELPAVMPPAGSYVAAVRSGDLLFLSGHGPFDGKETLVLGAVGRELTLEQGQDAARLTGLQLLAAMKNELGSLDRVKRIVKLFGMVNCADGFNNTPAVIEGASKLFVEVFGEDAGRGVRTAVGMTLPFDMAVELELVAELH
jgi:enamine deaminase RidA (YjgF/YER057c/UK114 family)